MSEFSISGTGYGKYREERKVASPDNSEHADIHQRQVGKPQVYGADVIAV